MNIFKRKTRVTPTCQEHQMLLALLEAHPNALATWVFNSPEHGIMNQWDVCMRLRKKGVRIETVYSHHINRYKRPVRIAAYRVVDKLRAAEIEGKMRGSSNG